MPDEKQPEPTPVAAASEPQDPMEKVIADLEKEAAVKPKLCPHCGKELPGE